jgi:hypothetical protein
VGRNFPRAKPLYISGPNKALSRSIAPWQAARLQILKALTIHLNYETTAN